MSADFGTPMAEQPKKSNRTTIIIIVVVLLLLCCCCIAIAYFGWTYGDQLLSSLGVTY